MNRSAVNTFLSCYLHVVNYLSNKDPKLTNCGDGNVGHQSPPHKPNVVFILSDDQGYADVGFRGSDIHTPNIDRLAGGGVVLENHYVQPTCSATRASLLTGRYGIRTQFWQGNILPREEWGLPRNETTMAEMFKRNGYSTYAVGKWHLGMHTYFHTPAARGFDYFYGFYLGSQHYYSHTNTKNFDFRENYVDRNGAFYDNIQYETIGKYNTHLFTKKSLELISGHGVGGDSQGRPFFLFLSYAAPHTPYLVRYSMLYCVTYLLF